MPYLEEVCVFAFNDATVRVIIYDLLSPRALTTVICRDLP